MWNREHHNLCTPFIRGLAIGFGSLSEIRSRIPELESSLENTFIFIWIMPLGHMYGKVITSKGNDCKQCMSN